MAPATSRRALRRLARWLLRRKLAPCHRILDMGVPKHPLRPEPPVFLTRVDHRVPFLFKKAQRAMIVPEDLKLIAFGWGANFDVK